MEKYKNFGLLVLTLLFALPAAAQLGEERHNFAVGINGGLNMSSVSFNPKIKLNTLNTMSMGVTMRYMSEKYFKMMCGVQMEINYSKRGWDEKIEDDSGNSYSRTMNYLEIPFMAHLAFGKDALNRGVKVFFNAGPQIGFFLGDNEKINWTTSTTRPEHGKEVENKFDYGITAGAGLLMAVAGKGGDKQLTRRDGYVLVSFAWVAFSLFGMLPFYISGYVPDITNAFFETMSGFTSTGATVLDNIESLPWTFVLA